MSVAERLQRRHDADQMRTLLESEAWGCFQRYLQDEIDSAQARVNDTPVAEVDAARGLHRGLLRAQQLPHRIIAQGQEPN